MTEVELFDGTVLEFPEGTSQDVIDSVARQETLSRQGQKQPAQSQQERGFGDMLYENIIGRGEVDTPGERLGERIGQLSGDVLNSIRSGAAIGATSVADLPALVGQLGEAGVIRAYKAITGEDAPPEFVRELSPKLPLGIEPTRAYASEAARAAAPSVMNFEPETKAGEFLKTGTEFATGAALTGGAGSAVRYGFLPGIASEAAGQATEGTAAEPYARTGAALVAPLGLNAAERVARRAISPASGVASEGRQAAVRTLRAEGVRPTAGQATGNEAQLYREAATQGGKDIAESALEDFTSAALRRIGVDAKRATPDALEDATRRIGGVFDDVVKGVDATPSSGVLRKASQALETYRQTSPASNVAPIFSNINKELVRSYRSGNAIPASTLKGWRSKLSKMTKSPSPENRDTAIEMMGAIDDAISDALTASGRPQDVARLAEARSQYRNLLAIEDAASRAGQDVKAGLLTPRNLDAAVKRQGRRAYVQGRGDLTPLARAGAEVMQPLPQSGTQPRLSARELLQGGATTGTGAGLAAVGMGLDPVVATAIGGTAAAAPTIRNSILSSPLGQAYMQNQLVGAPTQRSLKELQATLPGLLSQ